MLLNPGLSGVYDIIPLYGNNNNNNNNNNLVIALKKTDLLHIMATD